MNACIHTPTHTRMHMHACTHQHTAHTHAHTQHTHTHTHTHTHSLTNTHTHMYKSGQRALVHSRLPMLYIKTDTHLNILFKAHLQRVMIHFPAAWSLTFLPRARYLYLRNHSVYNAGVERTDSLICHRKRHNCKELVPWYTLCYAIAQCAYAFNFELCNCARDMHVT